MVVVCICEIITLICLFVYIRYSHKTQDNYKIEYAELERKYDNMEKLYKTTKKELELEKELKSNKIDTLAKTEKISKPRGRKPTSKK